MQLSRFLAIAVALFAAIPSAHAASTVNLPAWVCGSADTLYRSGFQDGELVPHDPSNGSGGAKPANGKTSRTLQIAGLGSGTQTYYIYLPLDYTPTRSWPLLLALHGSGPYGSQNTYASSTRDSWVTTAQAGHFIVVTPAANGKVTSGGTDYSTWEIPPTFGPSDYDFFAAVVADMQGAYNIERTRRYGWGFSAGAHVMHDLVLNTFSTALNANTIAAYGVSAGAFAALFCSGSQCDAALAAEPRKLPVDIHAGINDTTVPIAYPRDDHARLLAQGWADGSTVFYTEFSDGSPAGGHTYTTGHLNQIWAHLCPYAVVP